MSIPHDNIHQTLVNHVLRDRYIFNDNYGISSYAARDRFDYRLRYGKMVTARNATATNNYEMFSFE